MLKLFNIVKDVPNFPAGCSFYPPSFLSAVFVAEWRNGGPAHQVVKSVGDTGVFIRAVVIQRMINLSAAQGGLRKR